MNDYSFIPGVEDAEAQINEILKQLEDKSGMRVVSITLDGLDISPMDSPTKKVIRQAQIQLEQRVEESWDGQ